MRLLLPFLAVLAFATACISPPAPVPIHGPGAVFADLDDAAIDALAYAHREARAEGRSRLMHGGVLREVEGGFRYDEIRVASPETPNELILVLRAEDVAHFRTYPPTESARVDSQNERLSEADRINVDEIDPRHRPAYVLTPSGVIRVYHGERRGSQRLAYLRGWGSSVVAARAR